MAQWLDHKETLWKNEKNMANFNKNSVDVFLTEMYQYFF